MRENKNEYYTDLDAGEQILVYLIGMVAIGAVLAKENRTTDDFYLGGRKLGPFVTGHECRSI